MTLSSSLKHIAGLTALGLLALAITACNSNPSAAEDYKYRIEGVMVLDLNTDDVIAAIDVYRDNQKYPGATITLDGRPLSFNPTGYAIDSVYTLFEDSVSNYFGRALQLEVTDSSFFSETLNMFVPDSFYIPSDGITNPALRILTGLGNISLNWAPSNGTGGYILAAVIADSAYSEWGYSLINDPNFGNSGTIPPDALVQTDGINPDTGLYNIYVYSIGFSPDSALSSSVLPVPLPSVLDDNVVQPDYSARIGTIVVAKTDTVRLVTQTN